MIEPYWIEGKRNGSADALSRFDEEDEERLTRLSSLAEPLSFDEPPTSYLSSTPGSTIVKRLAWYGLASDTRKGYSSAIDSYEAFCAVFNVQPWPASASILEEWAANRIFGSTLPKQGQVKPETVSSYLSALKSYHIDRQLSLEGLNDPRMALIIKGGKRLFPSKKRNRLPITKDVLTKITKDEPMTVDDLNIDTAFKVA